MIEFKYDCMFEKVSHTAVNTLRESEYSTKLCCLYLRRPAKDRRISCNSAVNMDTESSNLRGNVLLGSTATEPSPCSNFEPSV